MTDQDASSMRGHTMPHGACAAMSYDYAARSYALPAASVSSIITLGDQYASYAIMLSPDLSARHHYATKKICPPAPPRSHAQNVDTPHTQAAAKSHVSYYTLVRASIMSDPTAITSLSAGLGAVYDRP